MIEEFIGIQEVRSAAVGWPFPSFCLTVHFVLSETVEEGVVVGGEHNVGLGSDGFAVSFGLGIIFETSGQEVFDAGDIDAVFHLLLSGWVLGLWGLVITFFI